MSNVSRVILSVGLLIVMKMALIGPFLRAVGLVILAAVIV